jgi:hypothetical protein
MPNTYKLIASSTIGASGVSSVTFSNIPQTYTDLIIKASARSVGSYKRAIVLCYFNGATTNLTYRRLYGVAAFGSPGSDAGSNSTTAYFSGGTTTTNTFGNDEIYIPNYTSSNFKSYNSNGVAEDNTNEAGISITANLWSSTSAITSITVAEEQGNNFAQYSSFTLYGIKNS